MTNEKVKVSKELMELRDKAFRSTARVEEQAYVTDVIVSAVAKALSCIHPGGVNEDVHDFIYAMKDNYTTNEAINITLGLSELEGDK